MSDSQIDIKQNLTDAGCDEQFIAKFMSLSEERKKEKMLTMLATHRNSLLDGIHKEEYRIYCLDYLVNKLEKLYK